MGKKNRKKTTWRRLSLAGEDGGSTNEDQDRSDSQHSDESSDQRHYQRYPLPSTNGRQPFYPHRSRSYTAGHNRYSRAPKVPYSTEPSAPFPQAPKLTDGEPENQDENYWADEQFGYYNPYFPQFATPTLVLAAPPYHPLQWQEDPRLPADCQYYFCLTQPVPQPSLPPTSPPSTTDSADTEGDGPEQAATTEQEEDGIPAEDYAYQTTQIPQPALTVPPPYVYPGAFMFTPYAYNTNNSYYWWNENGPGRGRRRKRRFIGGEGITYDRWPSRKDRSCDRLKVTTVQNPTVPDTSKPSVTSTRTINSTDKSPRANTSMSNCEESLKMEPSMNGDSNSIAGAEESPLQVPATESPRRDAVIEPVSDDKPTSNQVPEPVLAPSELLIRIEPQRQKVEMDQENPTSKEQCENSIQKIESKSKDADITQEPRVENTSEETDENLHLEPIELGTSQEAPSELGLPHDESCESGSAETDPESNQTEFTTALPGPSTDQADEEAAHLHDNSTNEQNVSDERIAAVHRRIANSNPFKADIERARQSKPSTPIQISNPAVMEVSSQSWSKESGSSVSTTNASATPTDRQHYHQLEDPVKCSKYYQLCGEVEDMADVERVEHPESKPTVAVHGGEIVMHEAADSASECGSEDVEMLGHRYETAAEKLYKNNTLSLAVEMLSTNQQLPYDKEFKPIMEGGITNPCYSNTQVLESYYGQLKRQASNGKRKNGSRNGLRKEVADSGIHTDESGDEGEHRNTIPEDDEVLFSRNQVGANAFQYQPFGRRPRPEHSPLLYLRSKGPWQGCCCTVM